MLKPTYNNIIATTLEKVSETKSGFKLDDASVPRPQLATVVAVGLDVAGIEVGDVIVYKPYASSEIKVDDTDYLIISDDDVLAKEEK